MARWRMVGRGLPGVLLVAACTSYPSLLREFDSISGYETKTMREPEALVYKDTALCLPWFARAIEWLGGGEVVAQLLAFAPESTAIDEPSSFARDRIAELPEAAGNNVFRVADTAWRMLWAVEKDPSPLNRAVAVHGLGGLLRKYREREVEPSQPGLDHETAGEAFRDDAAVRIGHIERTWPLAERAERPPDERAEHASALRELSALPARSLRQQRARIRLLRAASAEETDPATRRAAAESLLAALDAGVLHGLSYALGDPKAIVREAAIDELWQLGRASILPWILERLTRVTASRHGPGLGVDIEPQVRRCLAIRCWALSFDEAKTRHEKGRSPLEFLHELALEDPDPGLRLVGRSALANLLRRPIDSTGAWIPEWWQTFVTTGEAPRVQLPVREDRR